MARPFTRPQALQNAAFLAALRRTGNARLAARELGVHRATYTKRRAKDAAFAAEWDAALAMAQARLVDPAPGRAPPAPRPTRTRAGRLQLREPRAHAITRAAEQSFLFALSATANVRLSARAAGFSHASFYARARTDPAFAREMRHALAQGYARVEAALLASMDPASHTGDEWRHHNAPPFAAMTATQGLQLLALHQRRMRAHEERPHLRRRPAETPEAHRYRLERQAEVESDRAAEDAAIRASLAAHEDPAQEDAAGRRPFLPALDQVTGWSKADPDKSPHHADRGLFGGWTIADWDGKD